MGKTIQEGQNGIEKWDCSFRHGKEVIWNNVPE